MTSSSAARRHGLAAAALTGSICLAIGCTESEGEGTLVVRIYGEPFIEQGIPAEVFIDGWSVAFTRFDVAVSEVEADGESLPGDHMFDLTHASDGEGQEVGTLAMPAGSVSELAYSIDSLFVEGSAVRDTEAVAFAWAFTTPTRYAACATEQPLEDGGQATSVITIHADHLFYDDLDSEEPNVAFDLVASADTDLDGLVTTEELAAVDITTQSRYQVGSRDIDDLLGFIEAQTTTVGHIDGEGHCELGEG